MNPADILNTDAKTISRYIVIWKDEPLDKASMITPEEYHKYQHRILKAYRLELGENAVPHPLRQPFTT